jgi:2-oxoglutarate ferredoxin oxidoreductase subunit delta
MGKSLEVKEAQGEAAERAPAAPKKARGCVFIDAERCKGCGLCVAFCPQNVLEMDKGFNRKGYHYPVAARPEACVGCDMCGRFCPDFAIHGERNIDQSKSGDGKPE